MQHYLVLVAFFSLYPPGFPFRGSELKLRISWSRSFQTLKCLRWTLKLLYWRPNSLISLMLKLMSTIFYQIFFNKLLPFKNYEKCFLFHLKRSLRSRDIQIFVFPFSHLFLPVSHCFRGCSKINLKVYDVINCLNENLTHFIWYFEKEKSYGIET